MSNESHPIFMLIIQSLFDALIDDKKRTWFDDRHNLGVFCLGVDGLKCDDGFAFAVKAFAGATDEVKLASKT